MAAVLILVGLLAQAGLVAADKNTSASPNAAEADKLNSEMTRLYHAGKYAEVIPLAQRALAIRVKALDPEHPDVATSLNNLARLYLARGALTTLPFQVLVTKVPTSTDLSSASWLIRRGEVHYPQRKETSRID